MTPDQQHHIRNGIICVQGIAKSLMQSGQNLTGNQRQMLKEISWQAARVELACNGECEEMPKKRRSMTKLGTTIMTAAGIVGASAQVLPAPEISPWLNFLAILFGGIGAALAGQGIRRRLPDQQ